MHYIKITYHNVTSDIPSSIRSWSFRTGFLSKASWFGLHTFTLWWVLLTLILKLHTNLHLASLIFFTISPSILLYLLLSLLLHGLYNHIHILGYITKILLIEFQSVFCEYRQKWLKICLKNYNNLSTVFTTLFSWSHCTLYYNQQDVKL